MDDIAKNKVDSEQMDQVAGGFGNVEIHASDKVCPNCSANLKFELYRREGIKRYFCEGCGWRGTVR